MATRPKAVIESRNGEKFSPITIAKNVLTDDGQNLHDILSDRKEDMMTPTIENSSSMFKVGQGDNVDYSSNVVNGAYEGMVLKGKTMVNCIQESSSQDVVLPYAFTDGQYVTINDTKESGALGVELKGQTLVNLATITSFSMTTGGSCPHFVGDMTLTPNKYTIIADIEVLGTGECIFGFYEYYGQSRRNTKYFTKSGKYIWTENISNPNIASYGFYAIGATTDVTYTLNNLVILEGDHTQEDIPYFEGMTSCKMPILHTVGKNLFDGELELGAIDSNTTGENVVNNSWKRTVNYIKVEPNTKYVYSLSLSGAVLGIRFYDENKKFIRDGGTKPNFTTPTNCHYIRFNVTTTEEVNIQIENGSSATSYESYKSSILSLPEEVTLRGIPNSNVYDTLNLQTGVYTQNVLEYTLNGSELYSNLTPNTWTDEYMAFLVNLEYPPFNLPRYPNMALASSTAYIEGFNYDSGVTHAVNREGWYIGNGSSPNYLGFRIKRSRLANYNDSPREWIRANNIRILLNIHPIVTKINLPSTLKSWNTTTHIYSEIPENTLYPTLTHSNPTYPVILKPSTKYSIITNSYSNNHTNSTINFNLGGATASATVGNRVTTITTPSTLSNELLTMSGRGNKLNNVMVIEGDVAGDEPYFEGMCDGKSPILSNCGKNLFNTPYFDNMDNLLNNIDPYVIYKVKTIKLKPNTIYAFSHEGGELKSNIWSVFNINATSEDKIITTIYNINNWLNTTHRKISPLQITFKSPSDGVIHLSCYSRYKASGEAYDRFTEDGMFTRVLKNIQLEETSTSTQYESYKSNTTTFDQKDDKTIVLRSLPSGICDTLNVETGEYVQRIGEVILDGTKRFGRNMPESEYNKPCVRVSCGSLLVNGSNAPHFNMRADKIAIGQYSYDMNYPVMAGLYEQALYIYIPRTIIGLAANDNDAESIANAFNSWLTRNPITVQYPLATPIVSTIDIQGFPFSYTNGHVQLSSGSIGQSLTPKVEYSVVTNRNGQIRSNQKMVERHQKQLDRLQAMILTNLVNTQYEQTLTNLKYDLKNVREEVK